MKLAWLLACPLALSAHMVSLSTGELKVEGDRAHFELRIPTYEVAHAQEPAHTLLDHIRFKSGGAWGTPSAQSCKDDQGTYICTADYQFPAPVENLEVECTLASVTVPNHVHMLRAYLGDKVDQAVFDLSFTTAELRFRPPTVWETGFQEIAAGFMRAALLDAGIAIRAGVHTGEVELRGERPRREPRRRCVQQHVLGGVAGEGPASDAHGRLRAQHRHAQHQ